MAEIDLEALASGYQHRPNSGGAIRRAGMAAARARLTEASTALDVGGGRGDHARVFAATGARSIVVDRSTGMAEAAASVPGVDAVVGDAGCLPLVSGVADLVYFHLSIHYGDWQESLDEAVRVGRPGSVVWVWTLSDAHHRASYLAKWFPSVGTIDGERFPATADLARYLAAVGCIDLVALEAPEKRQWVAGEWRAAVEAGFVSTLQVLPPGELEAGLARFDATHPDPLDSIEYELDFVAIAARLPSLR